MKILLVDDSPAIIDVYGDLLRQEGYEVVTAISAIKALTVARAEHPDIGIIDYFLPDGNGAALTQSLLASPDTAHMLISLFSEVDQLRPALDAGAIDLISKHDPKDLFLLRVRSLVRQVEQWHYQETMRQMVLAREQDSPIRILLADDSKAFREAYGAMLEEVGYKVLTAEGVEDAMTKAHSFQPELAIIDYYMSDGNGDELIRRLLSDRITHDVMPFILTESRDVIEQSLSAGAMDVLYKSDPSVVFLNRIQSMERYIRSQRHKIRLVQQLFQHVPVAMIEIAGRYVVQTNPGFEAIFGFRPSPSMEYAGLLRKMGLSDQSMREVEHAFKTMQLDDDAEIQNWEYTNRGGDRKQLELVVTALPGDRKNQLQRNLLSISDVTALIDLKRAEDQAQQAELQQRWLSSILASIPDGIVVLDQEGRVRQINPAGEQMLGYVSDELVGVALDTLFEDNKQEELVDQYIKRKDGSVVPVSMTTASLDDEVESGKVMVLHDLEVLLSAESAVRANKAKDEFLASMSHELRTPLTTIIGSSEILAESKLNQEQQKLLQAIELSSRRQLALVSDILDLSKIESGKFEINQSPFDLVGLVDEVAHIFSAQANDSTIRFRVENKLTFEHQLIGDAQRIGQILINLLGNAFKFTAEGEVFLRVWEGDGQLHFSVADQGIGMSASVMSRLFQPFEQGDGTISRRFGGTGLGLHISKVLAELMSGNISVESVEGEGACFQLDLPLQISDIAVVPNKRKQVVLSTNLAGRVLLVEDTPEIQVLVRRMLGRVGIQVETADNGRLAIDQVLTQAEPFDLILMDMQMPEMDGIEATETLRQLGCDTPIVALTANVMQKHRDQFEAAGCDEFLSKPIDRVSLYEVLRRFLPDGDQEISQDVVEEEIVDPEMHELFLTRAAVLKEELSTHLSSASWKEARSAAHSIKGSGATFGYPQLGDMGHAVCDALDLGQLEEVPDLLKALLQELENVLVAHK